MGSLAQAKTYGGVGSILLLIAGFVFFIPFATLVLFVVGVILVLLAVKYISEVVRNPSIYSNMLVFVVLSIVAVAVLVIMVLGALVAVFGLPGFGTDFTPVEPPDIDPTDFVGVLVALLLGVAIAWILYVVSAIFLKRSFDAIGDALNVSMFSTTALVFLIGAVLLIILIGGLVLFIAGILQIVAFFSIPEEMGQPAPAMAPPPTQ